MKKACKESLQAFSIIGGCNFPWRWIRNLAGKLLIANLIKLQEQSTIAIFHLIFYAVLPLLHFCR
ncbi:hypothetical protein EV199_0173 [Pseudobacter ginsenosidimutans]|uniref:Uncharacterized protein n=1 Tax=Pseudobacter ginsenosidimutans TaxID=661488 RepID=A0A4Q7N147_9BACT|nr:hypothetical protein EV199_0173 [Pseudobacter ginsenosidimutans]